jgi:hypothetical protein
MAAPMVPTRQKMERLRRKQMVRKKKKETRKKT